MKRSSFPLGLILAAVLVACRSGTAPPQPSGKPTSNLQTAGAALPFDFYLLNLSWSPEFCYSHPGAAECAQHFTFILHGLWPQNSDGTYPRNCSNAPGLPDPSRYGDIFPDPGLLQHEWKAHGTCSGLSPDEYFSAARRAMHSVTIPAQLAHLQSQVSMPPDQIVNLFTAANPQAPSSAWAVSCGNNYLTAVELCLDHSLRPIACSGVRSCRANTVRIPPP